MDTRRNNDPDQWLQKAPVYQIGWFETEQNTTEQILQECQIMEFVY
jgi:hypothetical protein